MIATRPARTPESVGSRSSTTSLVARLLLLVCAGIVMQVGWTMVFTLSYHLTHGNDFTYTYLETTPIVWEKLQGLLLLANALAPGLELPDFQGPISRDIIVNALVFAFVVTGVGYVAAVLLIDLGIAAVRGAVLVVVLFEVVYQATLFLMPGLYTTDIFSYVMYGHISAVYDLNPYIFPPNYFPTNPLVDPNWIHPIWWDQPSVYGPLWTGIGWLLARLTLPLDGLLQPQPDGTFLQVGLMDQVFAYKLLMNGVQVVNLVLVWWLLGRLMRSKPRARLAAFVVFAWNPLMLFDAAGNAHNDALMVTLVLLAVVPLVAGGRKPSNPSLLLGTFCVGLSALIKYTTGLVGLFFIVPWARRLPNWPARVGWIGGAGALIAVVTAVLYIPWFDFPRAFEPLLVAARGKTWMYTNWAPDLLAMALSDRVLEPGGLDPDAAHEQARFWVKTLTRVVFLAYLGWELVRVWRIAGDRQRSLVEPILEASSRAFVVLILLVLTWVLEWYWMWPLALVSLLGWRRMLTKVVVGYTLTSLPIFYVHHYWSTNMPAELVLAYALPPLALPLVAWTYSRLSSRRVGRGLSLKPVLRPGLGME
ncbi:MAG: glycosyltransferase 87 family protein [Chloroflexota bacterium]|nr:glycosyltransferase 87 family protein [Chloroflexota bacterium]